MVAEAGTAIKGKAALVGPPGVGYTPEGGQPGPRLGGTPVIRFKCPSCQTVLTVPPSRAGTAVACGGCRQPMRVPGDPPAPPPLVKRPPCPPATPRPPVPVRPPEPPRREKGERPKKRPAEEAPAPKAPDTSGPRHSVIVYVASFLALATGCWGWHAIQAGYTPLAAAVAGLGGALLALIAILIGVVEGKRGKALAFVSGLLCVSCLGVTTHAAGGIVPLLAPLRRDARAPDDESPPPVEEKKHPPEEGKQDPPKEEKKPPKDDRKQPPQKDDTKKPPKDDKKKQPPKDDTKKPKDDTKKPPPKMDDPPQEDPAAKLARLQRELRDPAARAKAAAELGAMGDKGRAASRQLLALLAESPEDRGPLLDALARVHPEFGGPLRTLLSDPAYPARAAAARRLGALGKDGLDAVPILLGRAKRGWESLSAGPGTEDHPLPDLEAVTKLDPTNAELIDLLCRIAAVTGADKTYPTVSLVVSHAVGALEAEAMARPAHRKRIVALFVESIKGDPKRGGEIDMVRRLEVIASFGKEAAAAAPRLKELQDSKSERIKEKAAEALAKVGE